MVGHAQQQGRQQAAGEAIGPVQATAIGHGHPRHRQALALEPLHGRGAGRGQIPATAGLAQQHLGREVVAVGIGFADQAQHRQGRLLMQQHGTRIGTGLGGDQADLDLHPLGGKFAAQQLFEPVGWVGHGHLHRIAGHRQPGDRRAVVLGPVGGRPASGPPALGWLLHQLQANRARRPAGPTTGAQGELGEAAQLLEAEIGVPFAGEPQAAIAEAPELGAEAVVRAEAVEGKGRADQFLVGGGDAGLAAIEIGQQAPARIDDGDTPDRRLTAHGRRDALLQGRAAHLLLELAQPHRSGQGGQVGQVLGSPLGCQTGWGHEP